MILLYHVREEVLPVGSLILPGRWGSTVLAHGERHPFFFREHLLEVWRKQFTKVAVSRFNCTFAYDSLAHAREHAKDASYIYKVVPADVAATSAKADMLWLTWMGEPNASSDNVSHWCHAYWTGRATSDLSPQAQTAWEWLFSCPLKVEQLIAKNI
jgi:hypothetical protein